MERPKLLERMIHKAAEKIKDAKQTQKLKELLRKGDFLNLEELVTDLGIFSVGKNEFQIIYLSKTNNYLAIKLGNKTCDQLYSGFDLNRAYRSIINNNDYDEDCSVKITRA